MLDKTYKNLKKKAKLARNLSLKQCLSAGGHLVSAFSCAELLVALYYGDILKINPKEPKWNNRDRFILSKGHSASILYAVLADLEFFPLEELDKYCKPEGILGSHPDKNIPGVEATSGSLGHGLGIGSGMALAAKMDNMAYKVVVLMGDGECSEGSVWEAALFANKHKLENLIAIIDRNRLCVTDFTEDCICLDPLAEKWHAFGWNVREINGHSFEEISTVFKDFKPNGKPLMIIANTVKGKGVSFMENDPSWHTRVPTGDLIERAKNELDLEKK